MDGAQAMQPATTQPRPVTPGETMAGEPVQPKKGGWLKWIIIILVVLIAGIGLYLWLF